jgi:homoserine kinase type II
VKLAQLLRQRRPLPRGTIHGDVFIDNTRFTRNEDGRHHLVSIFDWEMAGRDHLALDVAITVCAWAFRRADDAMALVPDVAAALVAGYQRERPLTPSERRGLFVELRIAAIRFAASRLRDFGLPRDDAPDRRVLDPADFIDRLAFFEGHGERATLAALGIRRAA